MDEERVFALCEHLRSRGILDVRRPPDDGRYRPAVTVIIPTRDRAGDLDECLGALERVEYPRELLEVIVVDDGSADRAAVAEVVARRGCRLLSNERNRGPAYSRNRASREAAGEILAFIDSDCVADPRWLRELVPYFAWDRVGAVGGRTMYLPSVMSQIKGFEPEEARLVEDFGFIPVRLGPRILRTETAAVAALALMQGLWGDL